MSRPLFEELLTKGTLGEAIEHAKQKSHDRTFIQQYNLLGDPALELALPQQKLEVVPAGGQLAVSWPSPGFTGKATVEWLDEKFVVAERAVLAVKGRTLQVPIPARSELRSVRVYTVDPLRGDAMGFAELPVVAKVAAPAATPAATPPSEPTKQH
jgi:hypothetical protein